ncbi:MAG: NosD domain-containing protein [Promethearchaeota archaeon]
MKKLFNKRKLLKLTYSIPFLLVLTITTLVLPFSTIFHTQLTFVATSKTESSALVPHPPIVITNDADFVTLGFPGTGAFGDEYMIINYEIITTTGEGISISGTTKHFIIAGCYIDAKYNGIRVESIADETAVIYNNTIINCGVDVVSSNEVMIKDNTITNSSIGLWAYYSNRSIITENNITLNNYGIYFNLSNINEISCNLIQNNTDYGLSLIRSDNNTISNNTFVGNNVGSLGAQAYDTGATHNYFINNYWSDWSGLADYSIDGSTGSSDPAPLPCPATCARKPWTSTCISFEITPGFYGVLVITSVLFLAIVWNKRRRK